MTRRTSADAYNQIKNNGLLSKRRLEVYEALYTQGPLTASQIELLIPGEKSPSRGSNVHARLCELREMGTVIERGLVVCPISNMTVISFDVTDQVPTKIIKKITSKAKIQILTELCKEAVGALRSNGFDEQASIIESKIL